MNLRDEYPGQEKLLLLGVRGAMALGIGVIVGATIVERVVDPLAILLAGLFAYGLYALRRF